MIMRGTTVLLTVLLAFILPSAGQAQTTPLPDPGAQAMELAWLYPSETPALVSVNKHLEIGFKLLMEHRRKIDNYLDERPVPDVLNPFDPADLDVMATFVRVDRLNGDTLETQERIGFWYREYKRDFSDSRPDNWKHEEIETLYNMRVRFTPEMPGLWFVQITVKERDGTISYTNRTNFEVENNADPGYLTVGSSTRYFTRDNSTFFPVGQNLPCPSCHIEVDPVCDRIQCAGKEPWCHGKVMGPYGFKVYEDEMEELAKSGANYMRFLIAPWNLEIEFEKLNNYDDRMHCAWETDRILQKAEELGLLLHFNLQIHYPLEDPSVYAMWHWDYNDLECFPHDDPYCYMSELNLPTPFDFLKSERALHHYKNRLRYMIARYGYSTSIGVLELFSEANNIGQGHDIPENCVLNKKLPRRRPYQDEEGFAEAVSNWHFELARFIKEDLNHTSHILAVNYTGPANYLLNDRSYYSPHIDLATFNHYNLSIQKYYRSSEFINDFRSGTDRKVTSNYNPPDIGKPLMFSETGPGPVGVETCDSDMRWIKSVWLSPFTGLAGTAMNWSNQFDFELWQHLGRVNSFMTGVDLDRLPFKPYRAERKDRRADLAVLRSSSKERIAIGIVHNRTVNFYTRSTDDHPSCRDTTMLIPTVLFPELRLAQDVEYDKKERFAQINKMGFLVRYKVVFTDPFTGDVMTEKETRSNLRGVLQIEYPTLTKDGSPIYPFKAIRRKS